MVTPTAAEAVPAEPSEPDAARAAGSTSPSPPRHRRAARDGRLGVLLAVAGVTALRLPFLTSPLNTDEAGYLFIGGRWALLSPGRSLYGDFWVDRPPLLITFFGLADRLGGTVPLRLLGILACIGAVLAVSDAVDQLTRAPGTAASPTGPPAPERPRGVRARLAGWSPGWPGAWAAIVTATVLVTPATSPLTVNGEVLAAPFLAAACAGTVRALRDPAGRARPALLAGAAAAAAVLVKQNLVDAMVWGGLLALAAIPVVGARRAFRVLALAAAGGSATVAVVAGWTVLHGTSLAGVWEAMYPFRVASRDYLRAHPSSFTGFRQLLLLRNAALSGILPVAVLVGALALVGALHRVRGGRRAPSLEHAAVLATAGTLVWGAVSIDLGGFFWLHYLVQLVVPVGLGTGLVAHRWRAVGAVTAVAASISALVALALLLRTPLAQGGNPVGQAVGRVAQPRDTIVTVFGNADVTRASGLGSPYPELWFLPTFVRDPRLDLLVRTLDGPRAPTWFVDVNSTYVDIGPGASRLRATVGEHYRRVAELGGTAVWLHDGARRAAPVLEEPAR